MEKIVISRIGGIGDVVMTTAVVLALREKYPTAKIIFIVKNNAVKAVERIKEIDEVIVFGKKFKDSLYIFKKIWRADLLFLVDTTYRLAMLGALAFVKNRVGLAHKRRFWLTKYVDWEKWMDSEYDPELAAEILFRTTKIKIKDTKIWNKMIFSEANFEEKKMVAEKFAEKNIDIDKPYLVFSLYTAARAKDWPEVKWVELWKKINEEYPEIPIILLGEKKSGFKFTQNVYDFSGEVTLIELGYIIKKASLLINSCSLPMHIARAFEVPTIGLYGPTPVKKGAPPENVYSHVTSVACAPCEGYYSGACEHPFCMETIKVDTVAAKLIEFIEMLKSNKA